MYADLLEAPVDDAILPQDDLLEVFVELGDTRPFWAAINSIPE